MKRFLIILTVGILAFGFGWWANNNLTDDEANNTKKSLTNKVLTADSIQIVEENSSKKKTISNYISDEQYIHWVANHADTTDYICEISLHNKTVVYWYNGQCQYDYFTYKTSDSTIDVLWSYRPDCMLEMAFLTKSNGIKNYPKQGDHFATLTLVNDTTLKVNYAFETWIKKINQITKDSLFPSYYYLKKNK